LEVRGAAAYPAKVDWGTADRKVVDHYLGAGLRFFYVRKDLNIDKERVLYTAVFDPEILKDELNTMALEAGVKLYLHSWGTQPLMEENAVKGVFFESKSNGKPFLGNALIPPATAISSGRAPISTISLTSRRTAKLAMIVWLTNVDLSGTMSSDLCRRNT
jgi:hypothetical protein